MQMLITETRVGKQDLPHCHDKTGTSHYISCNKVKCKINATCGFYKRMLWLEGQDIYDTVEDRKNKAKAVIQDGMF
jgi:hypothetical protein